MEWLTVSRVTARFTPAKLHPDHKVVTIESIINRVLGPESRHMGRLAVDDVDGRIFAAKLLLSAISG